MRPTACIAIPNHLGAAPGSVVFHQVFSLRHFRGSAGQETLEPQNTQHNEQCTPTLWGGWLRYNGQAIDVSYNSQQLYQKPSQYSLLQKCSQTNGDQNRPLFIGQLNSDISIESLAGIFVTLIHEAYKTDTTIPDMTFTIVRFTHSRRCAFLYCSDALQAIFLRYHAALYYFRDTNNQKVLVFGEPDKNTLRAWIHSQRSQLLATGSAFHNPRKPMVIEVSRVQEQPRPAFFYHMQPQPQPQPNRSLNPNAVPWIPPAIPNAIPP